MVRSSTTVGRGAEPEPPRGRGKETPVLLLLLPPGTGPRAPCPMGSPGACRLFQVPVPGVPCKQILRLRPRRDRGAPGRARVSPKRRAGLAAQVTVPHGKRLACPGPWSVPRSRASLRSEHEEVRGRLLSEPCKNGAPTPKTPSARPEKPATGDAVRSTRSNREQPRRFPLAWSATATSHGSATVRRGPARRRTP